VVADDPGNVVHQHGKREHAHSYLGPHRHFGLLLQSSRLGATSDHLHAAHPHEHGHAAHTHGQIDQDVLRSSEGIRAVSMSLAVLALTAVLQAVLVSLTGSVALLADLIHNAADALTAIPLALAFFMRSLRAERGAGYGIVGVIFASALVAGAEALDRLVHPAHLHGLGLVVAAGVVGFAGNEVAARIRLTMGTHLHSAALVADGRHARVDGVVSLSVVVGAALVWVGVHGADAVVGLGISLLMLRISWTTLRTIRADAVRA
jgi:cation diffusion facilitator family transporter